jgi:hypothetical protein
MILRKAKRLGPSSSDWDQYIVKGLARLADDVFMYHVARETFLDSLYLWIITHFSFLLKGKFMERDTQYSGTVPLSAFAEELGAGEL